MSALTEEYLKANLRNRVRSKDAFMMMALWMEQFPSIQLKTISNHHKTGCVLVSDDRVVAIEHSLESHAIPRAIMNSTVDTKGATIFVSRLPCSLCTKIMVQAGITKCYYFPAQFSELTSESTDKNDRINYSSLSELPNPSSNMHSSVYVTYKYNKQERDQISSKRHVSNNSIGLSLYIPKWNYIDEDSFELSEEGKKNDGEEIFTSRNNLLNSHEYTRKDRFQSFWTLDETLGSSPEMQSRWINISKKFERLTLALMYLQRRYAVNVKRQSIHPDIPISNDSCLSENILEESIQETSSLSLKVAKHAMVLAHIASKLTDDQKLGVGAIIVQDLKYTSVAWNGFPKNTEYLDYPQAGADDMCEDLELKYNYILHAEQNALLWRNPIGARLKSDVNSFLVTTKCPCDECSPIVHDLGLTRVYTNRQHLRSLDDPLRYRGLSYDKCATLMKDVFVFDIVTG